jgi:hypothetical protein
LSLLREITIPTILNSDGDEELRISALRHMTVSIDFGDEDDPRIIELLSHQSLLEQLLALVPFCSRSVRSGIFELLAVVPRGCHQKVVESGIVPLLVRLFSSFDEQETSSSISLLRRLAITHPHHLLTSDVLSIFRSPFIGVCLSLKP